MRTIKLINIRLLAVLAAVGFSLLACTEIGSLSEPGVSFRARISKSDLGKTKASYGEAGASATSQPIVWNEGDTLTIYCEACEGLKVHDYIISSSATKSSGITEAVIEGLDSENLAWGEGDHTFYALYPGVNQKNVTASIAGKDVCASIPKNQGYESITGTGDKVVAPDMDNMFMVAKKTVQEKSSSIGLEFKPLSTALEFTITNKFDEHKLAMSVTSVSLVSESHALCGGFKVDLDKENGLYGRPETTLEDGIDMSSSDSVSIDFSTPVKVEYEKTLNFTFFLNPGNATEVNDLSLVIRGKMGDTEMTFVRTAHLNTNTGAGITFETHKKTRINGLLVPESAIWEIDGAISVVPWDADIDEDLGFERKETDCGIDVTDDVRNLYKSNVIVKNVGAHSEYVRAAICAYWADSNGDIIAPWTLDFSDTGFVGLCGTGWEYDSTDGFFYYKNEVTAGEELKSDNGNALFTSYTAHDKPTADAELHMTILVQAIEYDSSYNYKTVWAQ